jgi:hypothetical protein
MVARGSRRRFQQRVDFLSGGVLSEQNPAVRHTAAWVRYELGSRDLGILFSDKTYFWSREFKHLLIYTNRVIVRSQSMLTPGTALRSVCPLSS